MSSKRHIRRKECQSKLRHPTQAAAKVALFKLRNRSDFRGGLMGVYPCEWCGGWHVGHRRGQRSVAHKGRRL